MKNLTFTEFQIPHFDQEQPVCSYIQVIIFSLINQIINYGTCRKDCLLKMWEWSLRVNIKLFIPS